MTIAACLTRRSTISILVLLASSQLAVSGQSKIASADDTRIREMLATQPDYTAVQQFGFIEPKGGFGATSKVARLGRRFREENENTIFISEPGKPTIKIYPKRREFAEVYLDNEDAKNTDFAVTPEEQAKRKDVTFKIIGNKRFGKSYCREIEATYKDQGKKFFRLVFCVAPEFKNLVVITQSFTGPVTMTTALTNVSLGASEELFRVPVDFKKIQEKAPDEQFRDLIDRVKRARPSGHPIR